MSSSEGDTYEKTNGFENTEATATLLSSDLYSKAPLIDQAEEVTLCRTWLENMMLGLIFPAFLLHSLILESLPQGLLLENPIYSIRL